MRKSKLFVFAAALTAIFLPLAGFAAAPTQLEKDTISVSYADIDVNSMSGAKTLYTRLQKASEKSCGVESYSVVRSLSQVTEARACYADTLTRLVQQVDSAALDRLHNS